jgi:geranylgeranylglycerol-phosphate geranylgeranyltransferase
LSIGFLGKIPIGSLFDFLSFVSLFLAFFFAWLFVVWENDESDIEIDKVTNQDRPLTKNSLVSSQEWQILKYMFLVYALCFAFLCGLYTFVFILLFIFVYHIYQVYSISPTRLKRFPILSSILIAVNSLLLVWMGFFMGTGTEDLSVFPARFTFGILAIFFLVENAKNIKDIEGDRKEGIKTLPVILGEKWGKFVVGLCLLLGALLVPVVFYLGFYTFLLSAVFGLILFWLANKKNYQEKYLFIAYFVYCVAVFIVMIFS